MSGFFYAIRGFFGFGQTEPSLEVRIQAAKSEIGSQKRLDACAQAAYQIVQRKDALTANRAHPYEATILGDCLKVDSLLTENYAGQLSKLFGDAHFLTAVLGNGIQTQLQSAGAPSVSAVINGQIAVSRPHADLLARDLAEARQELHVFKGANGLTRTAEYPASRSNSLYWIGAVAILEAITNAWFLREQSQPVVAMIIAAAIAALNVGGSVWFGMRYREKNYPQEDKARQGRRYIIFAILFILLLNSGVAGYRLLMQSQSAGLTAQFIFESTMLFTIGIALGITAFNKGYALDDPFPGYGLLARNVKTLEGHWTDISQQHASFCEKEKLRALEQHTSLIQRLSSAGQNLSQQLPEMARMIKAWVDERDQLSYAYCQLQTMFRNTLVANHSEGQIYPTELNQMPSNSQLGSYSNQVSEFIDGRDERKKQLSDLIFIVEESQRGLESWIKGDEAQILWRWPI